MSSSFARTPFEDALLAVNVAFSFTDAVSFTPKGPTPVTVIAVSYTHEAKPSAPLLVAA